MRKIHHNLQRARQALHAASKEAKSLGHKDLFDRLSNTREGLTSMVLEIDLKHKGKLPDD